jgi:hypothetical protein
LKCNVNVSRAAVLLCSRVMLVRTRHAHGDTLQNKSANTPQASLHEHRNQVW